MPARRGEEEGDNKGYGSFSQRLFQFAARSCFSSKSPLNDPSSLSA